ncbi:MAG: dihydrodipicolinate reductase [Pseudomonadota bacterium]
MAYRVIQWATGHMAKMAARAMAERPAYEIVGSFVYNKEKVGKDLGEICGTRNLGVKATNSRETIFNMDADCVLFLAGAENDNLAALRDVCDLLSSGKNVITTSVEFIYPKAMGDEFEQRIMNACKQGHSTFHGLGVAPGFGAESMALLLTRLSSRIDRLIFYETFHYDKYPSKFQMFDLMGFGYAPDDTAPLFSNLEIVGHVWKHSAMLVADTVGLKIDKIENFRDVVLADKDLNVAAGLIRKGTVGAMNFGTRIISEGKPRIIMQHYTRMDPELAPQWPVGDGYWTIIIEGLPSISATIEIGIHGEIHSDQACLATAMHAIHAVPYVIEAKPGILTLAETPPVWGGEAFHR